MMKQLPKVLLSVTMAALVLVGCQNGNQGGNPPASSQQETTAEEATTAAESDSKGAFIPGIQTSVVQGHNDTLEVQVEFLKDEILSVTILNHSETDGISDTALERIPEEIVQYQSLGVDAVTGATVTSKAIIEAVAECITLAGGNADSFINRPIEKVAGETEEVTTDVLVIGGGTSGTTAALAAASKGAKVLVIEAATTPGGAGAMTGATTYAAGSALGDATSEEVEEQIQKDLDFLMDYTHYTADKMFLRTYLEEAGRTVDWLMEHGLMFQASNNFYTVRYANRGTQQFIDLYDYMTENFDLEIRYETHGDALIMDENGKIIGATATKPDGGILTVHCDKVILSTGGFGGNEGMLEDYVPGYVNDATNEGLIVDGSGHQMAWDIGASVGSVGLQVHNNSLPQIALDAGVSTRSGNDIDDVYSLANTPLLWVDKNGNRFANEDIMYSATLSGNVIYKTGSVFVVFDQATVEQAVSEESLGLRAWRGNAQVPLTQLEEQLEEGIEIGYVFKGNSIEELAANAGMNPESLSDTVNRYNGFIRNGKDEDYDKAEEYLLYTIEKGPYYIIQLAPRYLGTLGGLEINNNYQVLNAAGDIIDGLYATGLNASSWMGTTYVDFSGVTMSFALTSGRLAGEHAVSQLDK